MMRTSDRPMVLYHAVSSYQLLEVMLHRMRYHDKDMAVLLLPDFITAKYPWYERLRTRGFFDRVYLFPYLQIPHTDETQIRRDVSRQYRRLLPYDIHGFTRVYVAGAHFYFTLLLLQEEIPFTFFEDAAGMLSRAGELYANLSTRFPVHADIARRHGLFDGRHPLVRQVICLKKAQTVDVSNGRYQDFSVERALAGLQPRRRRGMVRLFIRHRLRTRAEGILLTQSFSNLGVMGEEAQRDLYGELARGPLRNIRLLIKRHPDDTLDYGEIFPGARQIREIFPAELLPYAFAGRRPASIYTLDSTGCENLEEHFMIHRIRRDGHAG